jgi:hypothetical protein
MTGVARHWSWRSWAVALFCTTWLIGVCSVPAAAQERIKSARYEDPTTRYAHGVLGDAIEHGTLAITLSSGAVRRFTLSENSVFEDTAARLADVTGDGFAEVIVVESEQSSGARLAVYGATGRIAATPFIGTRFRWLAPLGAADLDGDGRIELAYVDRPHLAKILRIWRFDEGDLVPVADLMGLTNHRVGETDIAGGIRTCTDTPEMILASADWSEVQALRLQDGRITAQVIGSDTSRAGFARAMACAD